MLVSARFELWAPHNLRRSGVASQRVQDGWDLKWEGCGTFKELTTAQSTKELGQAAQRVATARSRGMPTDLPIIPGSWQAKGPDGTWWRINNKSRTGNLTTLSLTEAEDQHGRNG